MPQDLISTEQQLTDLPIGLSDEIQNLFRTPPVAFAEGHGLSQWFRGTVGTNRTQVLNTSNVALNSYTMGLLSGGKSKLTISANNNPSGTGMDLSHNEQVGSPKPGQNFAMRAISRVMALNRIRGIITAPIDQLLQLEVLFGEHNGASAWKGVYASGMVIVIETPGVATNAQIRLTCNNPVNPGWFSFYASIQIEPAVQPQPPAAPTAAPYNQMDELRRGFGQMIRNIETGRNPW